MATLYYQGHGSFRITGDAGKVIYVDPYAGDGYDQPADLILVTHEHADHNRVELVKNRKDGCRVITEAEALENGNYHAFGLGWVTVSAVKAQNKNHDPKRCVGYLIKLDGVTLWAAGDTSKYPEMAALADFDLDWALLPTDGRYNMGPEEAAECAQLCGAKQAIPIHTDPDSLFDERVAERFGFAGRVIVRPGESIAL